MIPSETKRERLEAEIRRTANLLCLEGEGIDVALSYELAKLCQELGKENRRREKLKIINCN